MWRLVLMLIRSIRWMKALKCLSVKANASCHLFMELTLLCLHQSAAAVTAPDLALINITSRGNVRLSAQRRTSILLTTRVLKNAQAITLFRLLITSSA